MFNTKKYKDRWTGSMLEISLFTLLLLCIVFLTGFLKKKMSNRELIYSLAIKRGLKEYDARMLSIKLDVQAKHETANYTSLSYKKGNNLFGMKRSLRNYDVGELYGHATFKSKEDAINDMLDYLASSRVYSIKQVANMTIEQYALYLKSRKYYEDTFVNYRNGMISFAK